VSRSSRTPHPRAGKAGKRTTVPTAARDGIDYGPVFAAINDLVTWAFELAERDVAGWPEGRRRVRAARRFVLARLRGKRLRDVPFEDVLFTAGLMARIFEADLRLPMSDMVAILDRLGFPTEVVPLMPRTPSSACWPQHPPITPIRPHTAANACRPAPADACDACSPLGLRFRFAA
jgi:hypothetical protein